jgi:hypothetical protein
MLIWIRINSSVLRNKKFLRFENLLKGLLNYHFGRIRTKKAGSGSGSSENLDPDPHPHLGEKSDPHLHQIKIRIRIRIGDKSNPDLEPDQHQSDADP